MFEERLVDTDQVTACTGESHVEFRVLCASEARVEAAECAVRADPAELRSGAGHSALGGLERSTPQ